MDEAMEDEMAKRDIVDFKARNTIPDSGLGRVTNESEWGAAKATSRYGYGTQTFPPENLNANKPQKVGDPNNLQGNYYDNDCRMNWKRAAGETAESKPNYTGSWRAPRGDEASGHRAGPPLRKGSYER